MSLPIWLVIDIGCAKSVIKATLVSPVRARLSEGAPHMPEEKIMKVVNSIGSLKRRHPDCQVVRRKGRVYVINKTAPRYKVRQGGAKKKTY